LLWGLSLLTWAASVAINHFVALALGIGVSVVASAVVLVAVTVGGTIPSAPLRVGTFEYLCIVALSEYQVPPTIGLTYGLLLHAIAYSWPIVLGGAALLAPAGRRRASETVARETA
jgi:uncharacterized membrane protein YbhN (UPF0104 family)